MAYTRPDFDAAYATFEDLPGYSRPDFDAAYATFEEVSFDDVEARIAVRTPLGAAAVLTVVAPLAYVAVRTPLGAPSIRGTIHPLGFVSVPSPLGAASVLLLHDFAAGFGDGVVRRFYGYIVGDFGTLRMPISSCQGTLDLESSGYLQMVVPNAQAYEDELAAAESFYVTMSGTFGGADVEVDISEADVTDISFAFGGFNQSATVIGRPPAYVGPTEGDGLERELANVRAMFSTSTTRRARCDVDWLLRPGFTAISDGLEFVATYVNFYLQADGDCFMDVGS